MFEEREPIETPYYPNRAEVKCGEDLRLLQQVVERWAGPEDEPVEAVINFDLAMDIKRDAYADLTTEIFERLEMRDGLLRGYITLPGKSERLPTKFSFRDPDDGLLTPYDSEADEGPNG